MTFLLKKLPEKLQQRLKIIIPQEQQKNVFGNFIKRPTTFRTNLLKTSTSNLEKELKRRKKK